MEIKYKFANGDVSLVEVSDEIGEMIIQSRRVEENGERKQRYHCYSLDGLDYEGEAFACADTPDDALIEKEGEAWIETFKATLTEVQRRRLELRLSGLKLKQIAREEGVDFRAVKDTFSQIQKKFKLFSKTHSTFGG